MKPAIKLQSVVLDCIEPAKLAKFYAELFGGKLMYESESFVSVSIPGETMSISCQYEEDYTPPVWPGSKGDHLKMEHLDLSVEDIESATQFAISLGAAKPAIQYWQPEYGPQWVTLCDPEGHPFCFCAHEG